MKLVLGKRKFHRTLYSLFSLCIRAQVTEEKDLEVARILLPRLTRTTTVVCSTLASHYPHTSTAAPSSAHPRNGPLTCNEECLRVFASLDPSIRNFCKELVFSCSYGASVPLPACLISITNATTVDILPELLKAAAADISKAVGPVILLVTLQDDSSLCLPPTIVSLQQVLREVFIDHSGPVTVLLRHAVKAPKGVKQGHEDTEGDTPASDPEPPPPPDADRLRCLVTSLLDQTSRGFHGLVLVV